MTIPELLQKRAALGEQARAIILGATNEARSLTSDETVTYDKMKADIDGLGALVAKERALSSALGEKHEAVDPKEESRSGKFTSRMAQERSKIDAHRTSLASDAYADAFDTFTRRGLNDCQPEQIQLLSEVRASSPLSDVTGSAGAFLIPQGFYTTLTDAMKWYGGIRASKATIISTATGNTLPVPTANDTSNIGELLAENTQATQALTEMSFGVVTLKAYKYSSKVVLVPIELLQDSYFDVGQYVAKKLGQRIGRITNNHFTVGTGTNQPKGLVTAATVGVTGANGETAKCSYADLINLIHSVDPAYRAGSQWMFNDSTAAVLELMVDANNRPLLQSSLLGIAQEISGGAVDSRKFLLGYEVVINNDVASMAANAKSMVFGDLSNYFVRDVMDIQLVRFAEKYMDFGQVGFLAFYRGDGNLIDAGMHPVSVFVNSAV